MKPRRAAGVAAAVGLLSLAACVRAPRPAAGPSIRAEIEMRAGDFAFAILSDRTGGERPGVFTDAIEKTNLMRPDFVVCMGDLIEGYISDRAEIARQWNEFDRLIRRLEAPVFFTPGNHDLATPEQIEAWEKRFGPRHFFFLHQNALFVILDTEDAPPPRYFGDEQILSAVEAIGHRPGARHIFVFMHRPAWRDPQAVGWARIARALKGKPYTVFSAHDHAYLMGERDGRTHIGLAATGGVSSLLDPSLGDFDQIAWISMRGAEPSIANLLLDGVLESDAVLESDYNEIGQLEHDFWYAADPLFCEGPVFEEAKGKLRLQNPSSLPLRVEGRFFADALLRFEPDRIETIVPGWAWQTVDWAVSAVKPLPLELAPSVEMDLTARYRRPGRSDLKARRIRRWEIQPLRPCPMREGIGIDGRLDEWGELPFAAESETFRFAAAWDEDRLCLAARIRDSQIASAKPGALEWGKRDSFAFWLDAREEPERSANSKPWERRGQDFLYLECGLDNAGGTARFEPERWPEGAEAACARTRGGYALEVSIPARYLDSRQGGRWSVFRLNASARDYGGRASGPARESDWMPRWNRPECPPGSGSFKRIEPQEIASD